MGKSVTPKYRVEYRTNHGFKHSSNPPIQAMCWDVVSRTNVTGHGKPTVENLQIWRDKFNESFLPEGVNGHLSTSAGFIVRIHWCRIVNQFTREVMCEFTAPAFEVI